ncbi:125_t:CDS:1 [Paraglomus occultum]|uniref:125_t:CDS:1 n=1 Tax=Paraglomus occultum TaxID=144539 RepID=A0A9N9FUN2_9GLOM|nr:125_t:CDS:1 [Paraglomus occultum]
MASLSNTADNWEEITDLDFEDNIDLAQRITVHSVPTPRSNALLDIDDSSDLSDSEEYQLIETHTMPTYAAAAKWGNKTREEETVKETSVCGKAINDYGIKQKGMRLKNNIMPSSPPSSDDMDSPNRMKMNDSRSSNVRNKCKKRDNKPTSHINENQTHPSPPPSPSSSTVITPLDIEIPTKSSSRKMKNRHNTRKAKIATKKLQSQLVSPNEAEFYESYCRGDTNRDPEFVKYKICKKAMKYEKKTKRSDGKRARGDICEL